MGCKLYFVRHGESLGNHRNVFLGQTDLDLSELGYKQAARTAQYLKELDIDKVYSSDLLRAYNTCREYLKVSGKEAEKSHSLREIYVGKWENQRFDDLQKHFKDSYGVWLHDLGNAHPDDGESVKELEARIVSFVTKVAEEHDGETLLFFTHATVIRAFFNYAYGNATEDIKNLKWATNASVSFAEYNNGKFTVAEYGADDFLGDLRTYLPANV